MNKRLIVLFAGLVLLVLIIVLNSTVFTISEISVSSDNGTNWYNKDLIIESSMITLGKNIFMVSESKATDNIQEANPDVRVTSIERKFPNNIIIHITLRIPIIAINITDTDNYLITDWELNVIDIASEGDELYNKSSLIKGISLNVTGNAEDLLGTKLADESLNTIVDITLAAATLGITDIGFETFFKSIDIGTSHYAYIKTNSGVTFVIITDTDTEIEDQLQAVYSIYIGLDPSDSHRTSGFYMHNGVGWIWSASLT